MSKLEISTEDARDILWGDHEDFDIIKDDTIDTTRWSTIHTVIIKRLSDGKFFRDNYSHGSTESQDESPWEYVEPNFVEVEPYEKTVTDYREVA